MRQRLAAVIETTGELERHRSDLMRQLRFTMGQIRALRARLLTPTEDRPDDAATAAGARLAERFNLTPREVEVAMLLSSGAPNTFIAEVLSISEHTARHHTRHVLVKLGLHSRARAAALIARELGSAAPRFP
jgi:DNA-binding CsgD family transcriptional regulator